MFCKVRFTDGELPEEQQQRIPEPGEWVIFLFRLRLLISTDVTKTLGVKHLGEAEIAEAKAPPKTSL